MAGYQNNIFDYIERIYRKKCILITLKRCLVLSGSYLVISMLVLRDLETNKFSSFLVLFVIFGALLLANARASILVGTVLMLYFLISNVPKKLRGVMVLKIVLLVLLTGYFIADKIESDEMLSFKDRSSQYHRVAAQGAVDMFLDNPLVGIGIGQQFGNSLNYLNYIGTDLAELPIVPHNLILELLAETGIVGTVLFFILLLSLSFGIDDKHRVTLSKYVGFGAVFSLSLTLTLLYESLFWFSIAYIFPKETKRIDITDSQ